MMMCDVVIATTEMPAVYSTSANWCRQFLRILERRYASYFALSLCHLSHLQQFSLGSLNLGGSADPSASKERLLQKS